VGQAPEPAIWNDAEWRARAAEFARELGIPGESLSLVLQALTHRSLADAAPGYDNERLEFLGDSVLALLVNDHLFREHAEAPEGQLTKLKARYVCEPSLAEAASALGLGPLLLMAPGDDAAGGRARPSTLSDAFEAVLAALYLACGIEAARTFVMERLVQRVDPTTVIDHKSRLQELFQERRRQTPVYRTDVESGPAHDRVFRSEVLVEDEVLGEGTGRSKKLAEQAAAADALARLETPRRRRRSRKTTEPAAPEESSSNSSSAS
jgi:ribonuclease-3